MSSDLQRNFLRPRKFSEFFRNFGSGPERKTYRITWPYYGESEIAVDTTENGVKLLEAFDGNRTVADAVRAAGLRKKDKVLMRQLEGFLERCARAGFLTFRSRVTSSG